MVSNPFIRKPMPVAVDEDTTTSSTTTTTTTTTATKKKKQHTSPPPRTTSATNDSAEDQPVPLSPRSARSQTRRRSNRHAYSSVQFVDDHHHHAISSSGGGSSGSDHGTATAEGHFINDLSTRSSSTSTDNDDQEEKEHNATAEHFEIDGTDTSTPAENNNNTTNTELERHLSLLDLIAIGVGGTIGSGLFVLAGLVAHEYAGPSTVLSWAVSGFAACLSGCCYAELSGRIPLAGGAYAYSYVALGELFAVIAAACLSLEYIAAASAVARSWGDKCVEWMEQELGDEHWIHDYLGTIGTFSPLALVVSAGSVVLLLNGVKESKRVTNVFTLTKVSVVLFMIIAGCFYVQIENWTPFIPPQYGVNGIFRGATGTFFGYLGYDNISCLAGEAHNPKRTLPVAILLTLITVSILYVVATLVLTGMQPYQEISPVSGFPSAFYALGANVAGQITAAGEILTLPIVVLISVMAQPRLQFAMAEDGLLPPYFKKLDEGGNLFNGTLVAGSIMVVIASFVPFTHLNDVISCAVLCALSLTDSSIILMWHESPDLGSNLAELLVLAFHGGALVTSVSVTRFLDTAPGMIASVLGTGSMIMSCYGIYVHCPRSDLFGGHRHNRHHQGQLRTQQDGYFRTPLLPFWPCFGIFVNWYLIAQLELVGVIGLCSFLFLSILYYFCYARYHSVENKKGRGSVHVDEDDHETTIVSRGVVT